MAIAYTSSRLKQTVTTFPAGISLIFLMLRLYNALDLIISRLMFMNSPHFQLSAPTAYTYYKCRIINSF